jgi:hypothetical protein
MGLDRQTIELRQKKRSQELAINSSDEIFCVRSPMRSFQLHSRLCHSATSLAVA